MTGVAEARFPPTDSPGLHRALPRRRLLGVGGATAVATSLGLLPARAALGAAATPSPTPAAPATVAPVDAAGTTVTVDRGAWSDQAPYGFDDSVTYAGATWFVVAAGGVTGVIPGTDSSRWGAAPVAVTAAGSTTTTPNPTSSPEPTASSFAAAAGASRVSRRRRRWDRPGRGR